MSSPNARARKFYADQGYLCAIVEKYSPYPAPYGVRHDLFGIFDALAFGVGRRVIGLQATSTQHLANRVDKIRRSTAYEAWLRMGFEVHAIGWARKGPRGTRKLWRPKVVVLTLESHPPLEPRPSDVDVLKELA